MVCVVFYCLITDVTVLAAAMRSRKNTCAVCIARITLLIIVLFVSVLFMYTHSPMTPFVICVIRRDIQHFPEWNVAMCKASVTTRSAFP